jgi:hypothetical protein
VKDASFGDVIIHRRLLHEAPLIFVKNFQLEIICVCLDKLGEFVELILMSRFQVVGLAPGTVDWM